MTNQTPNPQPARTASQRIDDLEKGLMSMYQAFNAATQDLNTAKEAIKILGNKLDSVVTLLASGSTVNDTSVSAAMIQNNVTELKNKVTNLVTQGVLKSQETVADNSFVVGRELNDNNEAVNPRLQFAIGALTPAVQEKIKGSKSGDIVVVEEGKLRFEVQEVYSIETPTAPAASDAAEPGLAAPEAAAAESSTSTEAPTA